MRRHGLPLQMIMGMCCVLAWASSAREYFVDQRHPQAGDEQPGAEAAPFRTIQRALNAAQAGDTIWIKAGVYEEALEIRNSGRIDAPIVLSAWGDDRVRIGSVLRPLPPAGEWRAVTNSRSWAVTLPADAPADLVVILDGKPIVTQCTNAPPADTNVNWATYRVADRTLMVNTGGGNPAADHELCLGRPFHGVVLREQYGFWHFKKLEFGWLQYGLILCGHGLKVEDCYFHDTYRLGIFLHGRLITVRRCNFHRCGYGLGASGSGPANIIEECLFVASGQDWEEDIVHREMGYQEGGGPVGIKGDAYGQIFRYNIVADNRGGLWYDGGETGCRVIGNVFWDNRYGNGIYNEYAADDTLIIGNYFLRTSLTSSWCTRMYALENFFENGVVVWHNHDRWPFRHSFMMLRGNALVDTPNGYLHHYGVGWGPSAYPENFRQCVVDWNHVRVRPGTPYIVDGGEKYRTPESVRTTFGWELHGDLGEYNATNNDLTPEALGGSVVTFRVPWGPRAHLARPMLSDAHINGRWPSAVEVASTCASPSFFWRLADGNGDDNTLQRYEPWFTHEFRWQPSSTAGYGQGENRGCRWYIDAEPFTTNGVPLEGWPNVPELSRGNRWLVITGLQPEKIPLQGVGYWSPWLATAPGAEVTVSVRLRGKDLVPTDKGTAVVRLEFINETGQSRQRAYVVGRDDQGGTHRPELTAGSYEWTNIQEIITAPTGAVRMALFMGLRPSTGELDLDDIYITTASAPEPPPAVAEPLPPRLPLERVRETFFVDLSGVVNRALADDVENDGRGGWTDQGPAADMRKLATGERKFGGVPFRILSAPRSVVVLRSVHRAPGDLPAKVVIPVGRKADTLFFLHACAWTPAGDAEAFHYLIHYKDGRTETLTVGGQNLADWIATPVKRFPNEQKTFTTVAETVPVEQFGQGSVYRMEWNAPLDRRSVEIDAIEFVGVAGVPILLGITGVLEW